jgi:hypothetical protein
VQLRSWSIFCLSSAHMGHTESKIQLEQSNTSNLHPAQHIFHGLLQSEKGISWQCPKSVSTPRPATQLKHHESPSQASFVFQGRPLRSALAIFFSRLHIDQRKYLLDIMCTYTSFATYRACNFMASFLSCLILVSQSATMFCRFVSTTSWSQSS